MTSQGLLGFAAAWLVLSGGLDAEAQSLTTRPPGSGVSTVPDSVHHHMAAGRHWKATRALEEILDPVESALVADRMVLAEAQAGWRNWPGALTALTAGGIDTVAAPAAYWYALGQVRRKNGDRAGAEADLRRFLEADLGTGNGDSVAELVARSLLVLAAAGDGDYDEAAGWIAELATLSPGIGEWLAVAVARDASEAGAPAVVMRFLAQVEDPRKRPDSWMLEPDAWANAGDTARALEVLGGARPRPGTATTAIAALGREWRYRLALGDSAGAVAAMEALLDRTVSGAEAVAAARAHWDVARGTGPAMLMRVAAAFSSGAEYGPAVRAWRVAVERGAVLSERDRLRLARAYNGSGDRARAVELYRELSVSGDAAVGAEALRAWRTIRIAQGRHGDAATLQGWLLERYPSSLDAVDVVFFRAEDHRSAGRFDRAMDEYRRTSEMRPTADRAGLARMRWAQIHLSRGEHAEAARVFRDYLESFPNGRRWEEASYWAARAARIAGDSTGTGALLARIRHENPLSYYAELAARLEGTGTTHLDALIAGRSDSEDASAPELPLAMRDWLAVELRVLEVLDEAGLEEEAAAQVRVLRSATADSPPATLALARAFNEGGRSIEGIRMGWDLREQGMEWSRELLEVVYPFPHRELIAARSTELGIEPWLVAGLVRQESAFEEGIGSSAGAIGLMQIMPATGRQLARAIGPTGYSTESLRTAEVNVHLGTRYISELMERYDGDLRLVLSAYNAGPSRANRWRNFPEFEDPDRFVERIPFYETRNYVKSVTRNRALYRWLYGPRLLP